jgi:hypothetical protein
LKSGAGGWRIDDLDFTRFGDNKIIGTARFTDHDGQPRGSNPVVITVSGGKIVDMQGCKTRSEAERFAKRH